MIAFLALVLFGLLVLIGVPIAVALGVAAAAALAADVPAAAALTTVAQRCATSLDSFSLLAIPLFVLSGQLLTRGGAARRLVELGRAALGAVPGGLLHVTVLACVLFGAISGSAVAAVAAIGALMLPLLERDGYDRDLSAALNISAATVGLLIPPSNILIVYSLASGGVSIAALFLAGYGPGLLVAVLLSLAAAVVGPRGGGGERPTLRRVGRALRDAAPSLLLVVAVMGGIAAGAFTATEAAGIAVVWALVLALALYREIGVRDLPRILTESALTTGVVGLLIGTSMALSWVLAFHRLPQRLTAALLSATDQPLLTLLLINAALLVVGTVMDMTPAVLIFTPILLPVVSGLGIDPVHFGIIMTLNLCIGLCTPPVGTVLFVGTSAARTTLARVVPRLVPFYLAMLVALALVTAFPAISLWLPRRLGF